MSLRFRLTLLITCMFLGILLAGTAVVIQNARNAVAQELRSTANLSLQLLEIAFINSSVAEPMTWSAALQNHINTIGHTRHLNIDIRQAGTATPVLPPDTRTEAHAPRWFVSLVDPRLVEMRRVVAVPGLPSSEIVIRPDPADEITEAWREARSLLVLLLVFFLVAAAIVYIGIGRSLRPLSSVQQALVGIEHGDYRLRLPEMRLPDLREIAQRFNRMATALELSRRENQVLTKKTLAIQEDERRRLAQELHDEMGQSINAIKAMAVSVERGVADPEIRESAARIANVSTRVYEGVRSMMRRLRPVVLDELGLVPALRDMVDDWNDHHQKSICRLDAGDNVGDPGDDLKITIYRIVQECLTNVVKHSAASEIGISLRRRPPGTADGFEKPVSQVVELIVEDNGRGFSQESRPHGLGLPGMRERVESLDGMFQVESAPGEGTTITAVLPLTNGQDGDGRASD